MKKIIIWCFVLGIMSLCLHLLYSEGQFENRKIFKEIYEEGNWTIYYNYLTETIFIVYWKTDFYKAGLGVIELDKERTKELLTRLEIKILK
jgi:hypothetical protein